MSVKQRYGNWYIDVQLRGFQPVRQRVDVQTKEEAQQIEAWVKLQLQAGVDYKDLDTSPTTPRIPPKRRSSSLTIQQAFDKAMTGAWSKHRSRTTYHGPVGAVAVELLGPNKRMDEVTDEDIQELVQKCVERGNSPRTINARLNIMASLWSLAFKKWKELEHPGPDFSEHLVRGQRGRLRWFTREEEANILRILEETERQWSDEAKDFITVLIDTGLRFSECLYLQSQDYNPDYKSLTVSRGKNGGTKTLDTRTVPLTNRARQIIEQRVANANGWVWPTLTRDRLRGLWKYVRTRMGLQDDKEFVMHCARHTCATRLLEAGNDIRLVQQWLGHSDIETTSIYAKVTAQHLAKGAVSLDELQ